MSMLFLQNVLSPPFFQTSLEKNDPYISVIYAQVPDSHLKKLEKTIFAYSPDLPGCIAPGKTREEAEERMHEAIEMHIRGLVEDGIPVPKSHSSASFVAVQT
jgi:predicted RNase H-like HicB family nuclease